MVPSHPPLERPSIKQPRLLDFLDFDRDRLRGVAAERRLGNIERGDRRVVVLVLIDVRVLGITAELQCRFHGGLLRRNDLLIIVVRELYVNTFILPTVPVITRRSI